MDKILEEKLFELGNVLGNVVNDLHLYEMDSNKPKHNESRRALNYAIHLTQIAREHVVTA